MCEHEDCHETVDPATRAEVLERDDHRCQACGARGPGAGGLATLHVHHIERDPENMDLHAMANLTTLCRQCHSWQHNQPSIEDLPVELSDADVAELLPHDREILKVLGESGPASTGEIREQLTADVTVMTVRERLWKLMGLDAEVESRDRQVVDQHADTDEWGLTDQIPQSARGRIPDAPELLLQRAADERVRRALDAGYDRAVIADIFSVTERTTYHQEKRARAYQFPLDVLDARIGGRPPAEEETKRRDAPTPGDGAATDDAQQRLETMADGAGESEEPAEESDAVCDDAVTGDAQGDAASARSEPSSESGAVREQIQQAIEALQAIDAAL